MEIWQFWLLVGLVVLVIDFFAATIFFVNISFAFFVISLVAYLGGNIYVQIISFAVASALFLAFLYPFMKTKLQGQKYEALDSKYIGTTAKVISQISSTDGRIAIYDEEWNAVSFDGTEIQVGEQVKIVAQNGLIMTVKKI